MPLQPHISWCPATFALMPPLTCQYLSVLVSVFPLPSSPHHHSLSSLISSHAPFFCLFCSPVCRFSGSVHSPRQPSLGSLSSPSECSLGDMKPCQLPMSLLEHNTVGQADANTHTHTNAPSTFLHMHKSMHISQHTHAHTHTHRDLVTEEATRIQFTQFTPSFVLTGKVNSPTFNHS